MTSLCMGLGKQGTSRWFWGPLLLLLGLVATELPAAPRKSEAELIQMLRAVESQKVIDALDRLPNWYPESTNAVPVIRELLKNQELRRKAARALGNYRAELNVAELDIIFGFLRAYDIEEVMDGLKTLRGLKASGDSREKIVTQVAALLIEKNDHILRDACRTLAVHGDRSNIPQIEPLLKHSKSDVRKDAHTAIQQLESKASILPAGETTTNAPPAPTQ